MLSKVKNNLILKDNENFAKLRCAKLLLNIILLQFLYMTKTSIRNNKYLHNIISANRLISYNHSIDKKHQSITLFVNAI